MYLHISTLPHQSPPPSPPPLPLQKKTKKESTLHLLNPLQIIRILNRSIQLTRRGLLEQFPRLESNIFRSRDLRFFGNFSLDYERRAVHAFGAVFFVQAVQEIVLRCFAGGEGELFWFWLVFGWGFFFLEGQRDDLRMRERDSCRVLHWSRGMRVYSILFCRRRRVGAWPIGRPLTC